MISGARLAAPFPVTRQSFKRKIWRDLNGRTGVKRLRTILRYHRIADPSPWVPPTTANRIEQAATQTGPDRLRPIFDHLEGTATFEEIAVVLECLRNRQASQAQTAEVDDVSNGNS